MRRLRRDLFIAFIAITGTLAVIPIFVYLYFASYLESEQTLMSHNDYGVVLLDRKNRPFFAFYKAKLKREVSLSEIPKNTQQAIIAIEDKDFYHHSGFSIKSIIRAFVSDV